MRKIMSFFMLSCLLLFIVGCERDKVTLVQEGDLTFVEEDTEYIPFDEAVEGILEKEPDVYTLIENKIKIGSLNKELGKIPMDRYVEDAEQYLFFVTPQLYGSVYEGIITDLTIRLDRNPIDLDEADRIVKDILPEDAVFLNTYTEQEFIMYEYHSDSLPSPGDIEVRVGCYGDTCPVIGIKADIGNIIYMN